MKILCGIEPDCCIQNPNIIAEKCQDFILPKYLYGQLLHLKNGNFQFATQSATQIIDSLVNPIQEDLLIFKTSSGGIVYFNNEAIGLDDFEGVDDFDLSNPVDRYLLNLEKISTILDAKIIFITSSSELHQKCNRLNFEIATVEEFLAMSCDSWLQPEMLLDIQSPLDPIAQIEWQEEEQPESLNQGDEICWIEIAPSHPAEGDDRLHFTDQA